MSHHFATSPRMSHNTTTTGGSSSPRMSHRSNTFSPRLSQNRDAMVPIKMREDLLRDPFFSSTWSEFDQDRSIISKKTGDFWDQVEADMAKFEAGLAEMERDMEKRMEPDRPSVPSWAAPPTRHDDSSWQLQQLPQHQQLQQHQQPEQKKEIKGFHYHSIRDAEDSWSLEVDIGEYDPQGVKLSIANDTVIIRAGKSTLEMKQNNQSSFSQTIERRFTLPHGCQTDRLTSRLTSENILHVHCPRKFYLTGPSARAIKSMR